MKAWIVESRHRFADCPTRRIEGVCLEQKLANALVAKYNARHPKRIARIIGSGEVIA